MQSEGHVLLGSLRGKGMSMLLGVKMKATVPRSSPGQDPVPAEEG